jgi:HEPN domain-containing protein
MRDSGAEARRWLRQAENDLAFGELALREGFYAQACFVAHQTSEKALKSVAYAQGERLVLGHSIVELALRLTAAVPELGKLREQAGLLDQYYVARRRVGEVGSAGRD